MKAVSPPVVHMRVLPNAKIVVLAALAALAACADPAPSPTFTNLDYLLAESSGALSGSPMRFVTAPPPATTNPPFAYTCDYNAASQMFVCPTQTTTNGTDSGTYNVSYQLLDANDQPLSTRDTASTAAVRTIRTGDFSVVWPDSTRHLHNAIHRTLSGLLDGERIVNSQDTIVRVVGVPGKLYLVPEFLSVTNFRPRTAGLPTSFPGSGTISVQTTAFKGSDSTLVPVSALMTFNGGATVNWTTIYNGVTSTCTYSYVTGVTQCS